MARRNRETPEICSKCRRPAPLGVMKCPRCGGEVRKGLKPPVSHNEFQEIVSRGQDMPQMCQRLRRNGYGPELGESPQRCWARRRAKRFREASA